MQLRKMMATAALVAIALVSGGTAQAHYYKRGQEKPVGTDPKTGPVYIDTRPSIWIYLETNGHAGYQSGGNSIILDEADADLYYNHPCNVDSGVAYGISCIGAGGVPNLKPDTLIL